MHLFATGKYLRSLPFMGAMQAGKPKHCLKAATTRQLMMVVKVMKLTGFILLIGCLHASAAGHAQKLISLQERNAPVQKIFAAIRKQTGYQFLYANQVIETARPVTIEVKNASLEEVLQTTFKDQPLEYEIKDKTIIVRLKNEPKAHTATTDNQIPPIDIKGRIVNDKGEPIAGATVTVKGTDKTTITNANGEFSLKDINEKAVLVITDVRYDAQTIMVNGKAFVGVTMATKVGMLDETQVIAYGTTTRRLNTGNVASVKASDIEKQPVNNPLLALEGRVPGLFITQANGLPGGGITVRIQGQNSIAKGNDPFYVIDGVPYIFQFQNSGIDGVLGGSGSALGGFGNGNPLSYINPSDIESIEVLKDADATAIYGSRAANGAILITTKKGKAGATKVDFNLQQGWGKVTRHLDMLNTQQYLGMRREALHNDGITTVGASDYDLNGLWDTTRNTNWQKELIGGIDKYTNLSANVSGGTEFTKCLIGGTYHRETSVFPGDFADQKGALHFSIDNSSANRKFNVRLTGNYMIDDNRLPMQDLTQAALQLEPVAPPLFNSDGSLNWAPNTSGSTTLPNPLKYLYQTYKNKTKNLLTNLMVKYEILPGLNVLSSFGYNDMQINDFTSMPLIAVQPESRASTQRTAFYGNRNFNSWIVEPQITYLRTISRGKIEALIGTTIQQNKSSNTLLSGKGYNNDAVLESISAATSISSTNSISLYKYNALFGRINYNLENKYILNIAARRDGSSRFGSKNQFHDFGSVGIAWIFNQEGFMKNFKFLSFGKLKASYGTTGNDQIGDYAYMNLYSTYSQGVAYQGIAGLATSSMPNPYLQWEETRKLQFGTDLGFFNDRLLLSATYAYNRSSNQLVPYKLPNFTGFNRITQNFPATVQNTSWEFSLQTINLKNKAFNWSSNINFTIPDNKLIAFPNLETSSYASSLVIGQPVSIIKAVPFLGVDPSTGLYQYLDSHGTPTFTPNGSTDRTVLVNTLPKIYGGFENTIRYRKLELDFLFQFVKQKANNSLEFYNGSLFPGQFFRGFSNQPQSVLNHWQKNGDNAAVAKYTTSPPAGYNYVSDSYADASYARLKNLSLSYQVSSNKKQRFFFANCRIYLQGQNLLTITNYKGLDPENQSYTSLPPLRILSAGLQLSF